MIFLFHKISNCITILLKINYGKIIYFLENKKLVNVIKIYKCECFTKEFLRHEIQNLEL